MKKAFNSISC